MKNERYTDKPLINFMVLLELSLLSRIMKTDFLVGSSNSLEFKKSNTRQYTLIVSRNTNCGDFYSLRTIFGQGSQQE